VRYDRIGLEEDQLTLGPVLDVILLQLHPCQVSKLVGEDSHQEYLGNGPAECLVECRLNDKSCQCESTTNIKRDEDGGEAPT